MNIKGIIRLGEQDIEIRDTNHFNEFMKMNKHLTMGQLKQLNEHIGIELFTKEPSPTNCICRGINVIKPSRFNII